MLKFAANLLAIFLGVAIGREVGTVAMSKLNV